MNQVNLYGHLGVDPTLRFTPDGRPVCNFTVATNERYTDRNGQLQQRTEWHRIVVWGKSAQNSAEFLNKGRAVLITGQLRTRSWEDREGVKRFTTEVYANRVTFLGSNQPTRAQQAKPTQTGKATAGAVQSDDVPPVDEEMGGAVADTEDMDVPF